MAIDLAFKVPLLLRKSNGLEKSALKKFNQNLIVNFVVQGGR